ncbi:serine hydrolase domain-containing protein [Tenggerimyces flavus]|uniref:Serine hydrolase domain-containing protein n=1 Tax=Tenggerimyces flavus TaxID=1708749 RepID=A0ABV7YH71_9ACTN|nr:serine hydrolase domain-containing protein [Tenggerimyces flavus]MBM7783928.1 CubicO group peptidase (beta-lactamase class C family) [Tenggerimyces flavus]
MASEFTGVAVLAENGQPVSTRTYGDVDATMAFQIASGSKQFAACAVLLLVDRGQLALDDTVAQHLGGGWDDVTVHQLLTHTSRLGHWAGIPGLDTSFTASGDEIVAQILAAPLGEQGWHYSSPGYILAAKIVEQASGRVYADFVTAEIFEPLGMRESAIAARPANAAPAMHDGEPTDEWNLAVTPGAGDAWCTAADLVRFEQGLHVDRTILSDVSYRAMVAPHAPIDGSWRWVDGWLTGETYGYGVAAGTLGGERAYFHPGDNPGFQSFRVWLPDTRRALVVLTNDDTTDRDPILRGLLADH